MSEYVFLCDGVPFSAINIEPVKISFGSNLPILLFSETTIQRKELDNKVFDLYLRIEDYLKKSPYACVSNSGDLVGFKS